MNVHIDWFFYWNSRVFDDLENEIYIFLIRLRTNILINKINMWLLYYYIVFLQISYTNYNVPWRRNGTAVYYKSGVCGFDAHSAQWLHINYLNFLARVDEAKRLARHSKYAYLER